MMQNRKVSKCGWGNRADGLAGQSCRKPSVCENTVSEKHSTAERGKIRHVCK